MVEKLLRWVARLGDLTSSEMYDSRLALVFIAGLLAGCGAAKAARDAGQKFDTYGCIARDFKGEAPCPADRS